MGKYSRRISERLAHSRIKEGYCLICGAYGKLTADHVPPKSSVVITRIEQRHIAEALGEGFKDIKGVISNNGSKFKTICQRCNNVVLGMNDPEVAKVSSELTKKVNSYFSDLNAVYPYVSVSIDATRYARAMLGHILSATSVRECREPLASSTYFDPIRRFVLGEDGAMLETHEIFYWFYPYQKHISAKFLRFFNEGHVASLSVLSFFPLAFLVSEKNQAIIPSHARLLKTSDTSLVVNLSSAGVVYADFPFHELRGNQMMAINDSMAIISYPAGR